ncbi:CDP-diacylglycerol--glycerol-3-phosphate 3-phosphatidyltransferase [secondary endosymbiont of Heteropsylla cubana]|uniref:CDP-diacylglycerol--glycerol-3-phosphate 3-phosphatidyltransferase n=1 Tax=secondary endosymbiont of Heteropsylla cubana TaxID=134287 RepID=J7GZ32_9ENTR|nr:CDP-diacylglycerol--glycerol-3-phosphate 3-phosphatidyltransferase [secondary endosymbiont of Heteropsylla cubana]AFP85868.1 CDP-diacylglycerol--glycerol-3-phosphate 3-phosphatidyltransferase [secondary endosymbiont of Heteropsylla cubana]
MQINIPTWLTLLRIFMIPFFILAFYLPVQWSPLCTTLIFVFASITDWFDGFLARRWKQTTRFGSFLDPVTDKVMVAMALVLVAEHFHSFLITLPAMTIIAREIIISALREWMAKIKKRKNVTVSWIGKIKTTTQMLALIALLSRPDDIVVSWIGIASLYVAAILTFLSMFQYLYAARYDLF